MEGPGTGLKHLRQAALTHWIPPQKADHGRWGWKTCCTSVLGTVQSLLVRCPSEEGWVLYMSHGQREKAWTMWHAGDNPTCAHLSNSTRAHRLLTSRSTALTSPKYRHSWSTWGVQNVLVVGPALEDIEHACPEATRKSHLLDVPGASVAIQVFNNQRVPVVTLSDDFSALSKSRRCSAQGGWTTLNTTIPALRRHRESMDFKQSPKSEVKSLQR